LELTESQEAQVRALGATTEKARRTIFARYRQGQPLDSADRDHLRAIAERHNAAFLAILTPEQRAKAEKYLAARRAALRQGRDARAPALAPREPWREP
jgi:Spy/CpxP family protein refolding chaperone